MGLSNLIWPSYTVLCSIHIFQTYGRVKQPNDAALVSLGDLKYIVLRKLLIVASILDTIFIFKIILHFS